MWYVYPELTCSLTTSPRTCILSRPDAMAEWRSGRDVRTEENPDLRPTWHADENQDLSQDRYMTGGKTLADTQWREDCLDPVRGVSAIPCPLRQDISKRGTQLDGEVRNERLGSTILWYRIVGYIRRAQATPRTTSRASHSMTYGFSLHRVTNSRDTVKITNSPHLQYLYA